MEVRSVEQIRGNARNSLSKLQERVGNSVDVRRRFRRRRMQPPRLVKLSRMTDPGDQKAAGFPRPFAADSRVGVCEIPADRRPDTSG
jgi:hypothetical protein